MTRSIGEVGRQKSFFGENRDSHKTLFMNVADSFSIPGRAKKRATYHNYKGMQAHCPPAPPISMLRARAVFWRCEKNSHLSGWLQGKCATANIEIGGLGGYKR